MCCARPCLIRRYVDGLWCLYCLNCDNLTRE